MNHLKALITSLRAFLIAAIAGGGAAQAQRAVDPEEAAWNAARSAGTSAAFERYLDLYPVGRYAEEAFRCVVELSVDPAAVCAANPGAEAGGGATRSITTRGVAADVY